MASNFPRHLTQESAMVTGEGIYCMFAAIRYCLILGDCRMFGGGPMKFAHFSHVGNKPGMTVAERYEQLWRELETCDELGFDFGFTVEHHFNPNESWMPSPAIYCTGAAGRTRKMRHGPMGFVVPLYDPLRIAEDAAVLDNVLNGRLELGLVSGIVPDFFGPYRAVSKTAEIWRMRRWRSSRRLFPRKDR